MRDRFKGCKAGCIGPAMVLLGVMAAASGLAMSFVLAILTMQPGQQRPEPSENGFWYLLSIGGFYLVGAGLFVMLFQGVLLLVRRAGVAQSNQSKE